MARRKPISVVLGPNGTGSGHMLSPRPDPWTTSEPEEGRNPDGKRFGLSLPVPGCVCALHCGDVYASVFTQRLWTWRAVRHRGGGQRSTGESKLEKITHGVHLQNTV